MNKEIFENSPPEDLSQIEILHSFPPTTHWVQNAGDGESEEIKSKIVREAPDVSKWDFSLRYKDTSSETEGRLAFSVSQNEKKEWNIRVEQATGTYKDINKDIDSLLSEFKVSTYSIQGRSEDKYSPAFEKAKVEKRKRDEKEINREIEGIEKNEFSGKNSFRI